MAKSKAVKAMDVGAQPMKTEGMSDWEHEDNARTLMKAGEILSDPKKMKGAHKHMKKQKKAMRSVSDLIDYKNKMHGPGSENKVDDGELEE